MSLKSVYLDTSALVKRYVIEQETDRIDGIYEESYSGRLILGFSVWNVGEVAVVLDKYEKRGIVKDAKDVFSKFIGESHLLSKLNQLKVVPMSFKVVMDAVNYVFKHGIYMADAVQIASAKNFDALLTYDKKLAQIASIEGLNIVQ